MGELPSWRETYRGGSLQAEQAIFRVMIREMFAAQLASARDNGTDHSLRMMYGKTIVGITDASLHIDRILPADLAVGHFHPGVSLPAIIRFSNASRVPQTDGAPDIRGLAVRLLLPEGAGHDLLFANCPTSLARDAEQFFQFFMAQSTDRELLFATLATRLGLQESRRISVYLKSCFRLCSSLAREHFWSGSAFLWGDRPVRIELIPTVSPTLPRESQKIANDALRAEFAQRLGAGDIRFRFALQQYIDEKRTPVEDAAVEWRQGTAPSIEIGTLIIPRQDILSADGEEAFNQLNMSAFSPWNAPEQFRPLGSLNRLRRLAYEFGANDRLSAKK